MWDAASGEQRQGLEGPGEAVNWLQWHPRGNVLLAGSEDFTAWLWNAQTGACMHVRCHSDQECLSIRNAHDIAPPISDDT